MQIGEFARASGVSTKTIRYYEQIGVLAEPARTASGYRDYDPSAVDRLRFVKSSQRAGLTLAEITGVMRIADGGEAPCGHVADLIDTKLVEIKERLAALTKTRTELRKLKKRAETLDPNDCGPDSICNILEPGPAPTVA